MKKILLIATGGTIASKKSDSGLKPQISPEELVSYIPSILGVCEVETCQLLSLDSSNMEPKHWSMIVECIQEHYETYDGFVIAHGTDTMAYTAAGLSYMIQNSSKPIVITGSQKPIDLDITDAKTNLLDSFIYAADDKSQGIVIVFDGKVIAGTRAKKIRSKSYNAFDSIDFPALAMIQDGQIMRYIPMEPYQEDVKFYTQLNERIFLLKLIPGIQPEILKYIFEHYDAVIVESFGVGGIPKSISEDFYGFCKQYPEKTIVMATQVAHEGSDMTVYEVGHEMKARCNFLESYDMTLESVIAKTMWMLANQEISKANQEDIFYKNINYDVIFGKNRKC
ncbi:MAG: asparaginase [Agathobacter sp.]|nr:asparaginase [Agathobacter sp.]MBQ2902679.1 asparaginase [Agathobacter sp.]